MSHTVDLVQALSRLPHGAEFRFVDELIELHPAQSARARWTLSSDQPFLRGHFPGRPLLPGVMMIEALAQLGGILVQTRPDIAPLDDLRLTAVRQFKILGSIVPGEALIIEAKIDGVLGTVAQVSGSIANATTGDTLATGAVVLAGREPMPA